MGKRYKIVLIEPSPLISSGIACFLSDNMDFDVVGIFDSFDKSIEKLQALKPDMIIINPSVIDFGKRYMIKSLFQSYPSVILIALVSNYVENALLKQYHAVIEINDNKQKIESKLRESLTNANVNEIKDNYELSGREIDVLIAVAKGKMNKEIADDLHISIHTVMSHRKNISRKTGIKSVSGLTVYALLNNLIDESSIQ